MRGTIICGIAALGLLALGCDQQTQTADPALDQPAVEERTAGATEASESMREGAAQATAEEQAEAQKMLDQVMEYIKENKYDLAEQTLTQLEGMKADLPAGMQSSIEQARTMLNSAKPASNVPAGLPR